MLKHVENLYRELGSPKIKKSKTEQNLEGLPQKIKKNQVEKNRAEKAVSHTKEMSSTESHPLELAPENKLNCLIKMDYDESLMQQENIQPREKLEAFGVQSLSNTELVSLLLGSGSKNQPVKKLAGKVFALLARQPFATSLESLKSLSGMGLSKSALILASMELGRRLLCPSPKKLNRPEVVFHNILHFADQQENLIAINLNGACEVISIRLVTRGTVNRSMIHPREVFSYAVREQAHSVIIAHNHPTGHLKPSEEDLQSTKTLQKAGEVLGIKLLDHIIFSADNYLSLMERGYIKH